jgi:uroporphyrinogen decarboxylase
MIDRDDKMSRKERMLVAMCHGVPDRVPVSPDASAMVPARLTGKPFWDVFLYENPYIGDAYIDFLKRFGCDGWYIYDELPFGNARLFRRDERIFSLAPFSGAIPAPMAHREIIAHGPEDITVMTTVDTPGGPLTKIELYPVADVPWPKEKWIKDIDRDWPRMHWVMGDEWTFQKVARNRDKLGDLGVYSWMLFLPLDWWFHIRAGGSEQLTFDLTDEPEKMEEIFSYYSRFALAQLDAFLEAGPPDELHIQGAASSLSLSSLSFYEKYDLPFLKELTARCKRKGLISHQHTCGRAAKLVQIDYDETDLDVFEPLEPPPSGDIDLAEAKKRWGDKLCLKGNLNTFDLMLRGAPEEVERAAKAAIDAAGEGGGFILSTGDQVGRDTPDANLAKMVQVSKTYGVYRQA